jgi:hypothetical protein
VTGDSVDAPWRPLNVLRANESSQQPGEKLMNIAALKGEATVGTLAKRLLGEPSKRSSKTSDSGLEAALVHLNPHLSHIGDLEKGTSILVPEELALAADESIKPLREMAEELVRQSEDALTIFGEKS